MKKFDFSGWATKNDLECSDGLVIRRDAFKENDGKIVPLVWNHQHNDPANVLGHAQLENRENGVYAYCSFNDNDRGKMAKQLVSHGDIASLSIWANGLKKAGSDVVHGLIREVSLVLAGANPGAYIDSILEHSIEGEEGAIIYTGEPIELFHAEEDPKPPETKEVPLKKEEETVPKDKLIHADGEETMQDVFNTLSEKQKTVVYALIGQVIEGSGDEEEESDGIMKHNVFEGAKTKENKPIMTNELSAAIFKDAKRLGSLKESFLAHAAEMGDEGDELMHASPSTYGINNIEYLFPDAKTVTNVPSFIQREMGWVPKVMGAVHHTPFSRIKSVFADITEADARAKGYIKSDLKTEEVFSLLKRTTDPTTVYKKQKLDRDDVIDITDFDVVAWLKSEMRMMLDEEIARAILVGDGRLASSNDKIDEAKIRPIWKDADLYTIKADVVVAANATADVKAKAFERVAIKSRKDYKGAGNPTLFTTEDMLTDMLLREDSMGRKIYTSVNELAIALRVSSIVTSPVLENLTRTRTDNTVVTLLGLIVNLIDYNVGADKGGAVAMFDDFDIDYNQQKYLIETRCSGALITPYSAIALEQVTPTP